MKHWVMILLWLKNMHMLMLKPYNRFKENI
jgi:hypothetical protein